MPLAHHLIRESKDVLLFKGCDILVYSRYFTAYGSKFIKVHNRKQTLTYTVFLLNLNSMYH